MHFDLLGTLKVSGASPPTIRVHPGKGSAPSDVPVTSQVDIEDSSSPSSPHSVSSTIRRNLESTDTGICSEHPISGVLPAERHGRQSTTEIELAATAQLPITEYTARTRGSTGGTKGTAAPKPASKKSVHADHRAHVHIHSHR